MDEKILKALGEPRRYQLLQLMSCRSYCVRALAVKSGLSESAVSQHLKILREAGLVHGIKKGYYTHYRLDKDALGQVIAELEQLRTIDKKRLKDKVCHLDGEIMRKVNRALMVSLELDT